MEVKHKRNSNRGRINSNRSNSDKIKKRIIFIRTHVVEKQKNNENNVENFCFTKKALNVGNVLNKQENK